MISKMSHKINDRIRKKTYIKTIISIAFVGLIGSSAIKSASALTYSYDANTNELKSNELTQNEFSSKTSDSNQSINPTPSNPQITSNTQTPSSQTSGNTQTPSTQTPTSNLVPTSNPVPTSNQIPGKRLKSRSKAKVKPLPTYSLPSGEKVGIILNIAQRRLYYFHPNESLVSIFPVAVGKAGWSTPKGETTVVAKEKNPAWRPPPSIHREVRARGGRLPLIVPPGPRNPLGRYAIRLGIPGILIHGTNQPWSIGKRATHGCIRMHSKNIEQLFKWVEIGTPVRIISEP